MARRSELLIEGKSVHTYVTERIIAELEAGVNPWVKPWTAGGDLSALVPLNARFNPYGFYNAILLSMVGRAHGYCSRVWMTENRARRLGARVRSCEMPTPVRSVFRFPVGRHDARAEGKTAPPASDGAGQGGDTAWGRGMRVWMVYNCNQIEGLPAKFLSVDSELPVRNGGDWIPDEKKFGECRRFFGAAGAHLIDGGGEAYFSWSADNIGMPPASSFDTEESYWATLAHEYIHWTGHASRLNRPFTRKRNQKEYAREELVAEIGSAFLCRILGITPEVRQDHAAYIDCWLKVLKEDSQAVLKAAVSAQQAVDFLLDIAGCTPREIPGAPRIPADPAVVEQGDLFAGGQLVLAL